MRTRLRLRTGSLCALTPDGLLAGAPAYAQATMVIALPERTRLPEDRRAELATEIRNAATVSGFRVTAGGATAKASFRPWQAVRRSGGAPCGCEGRQADQIWLSATGRVRRSRSATCAAMISSIAGWKRPGRLRLASPPS